MSLEKGLKLMADMGAGIVAKMSSPSMPSDSSIKNTLMEVAKKVDDYTKEAASAVKEMADKYKVPRLCNYYCANQCPIGQEYVPEVKVKELSQITLELLASLNAMNSKRERFIEITVNGKIDDDEIADLIVELVILTSRFLFFRASSHSR